MRGLALLLFVAAASAQDNRGFVNQRLLARNFFEELRQRKAPPAPGTPKAIEKLPAIPPSGRCAIPLLEVPAAKNIDPGMAIPPKSPSGDDRMILPTLPVCGKR